jgi:hypothetical protein
VALSSVEGGGRGEAVGRRLGRRWGNGWCRRGGQDQLLSESETDGRDAWRPVTLVTVLG